MSTTTDNQVLFQSFRPLRNRGYLEEQDVELCRLKLPMRQEHRRKTSKGGCKLKKVSIMRFLEEKIENL